jgi:hypothetical protein
MRERYDGARKEARGQLLDEMEEVTGYHRKALIRRMHASAPRRGPRPTRRRGRPRRYGPTVVGALRLIWTAAGYPWSVRLKALLPDWLPHARRHLTLSTDTEGKLRTMSPRQMDRCLAKDRRTLHRRLYGRTKPGRLLKHQIPLRTDRWDVSDPGFTEIDLVSHSGDSAAGEFAHSLNVVDILSAWVETRAVLGKSQVRVQEGLETIRQALPFALGGIDSDNGSEFINAHLKRYCRTMAIQFTRGRPYKKDDNAHIEQKNWTHVRKLVGYERYDTGGAVDALNALYAEVRLLQNLFLPSVKLITRERVGSRMRRRYDAPQTPLQRLLVSGKGDAAQIAALVRQRQRIDPFALAARIDRQLEHVYRLANRRVRAATVQRRPVDGARPVDAQTAPTRSLEARKGRRLPHRQPASSSTRSSVTRLMARRCQLR